MEKTQSPPQIDTLDLILTETALTCDHGDRALQSLDTGDWGWVDELTEELDAAEDRTGTRAA